MRSTRSLVLGYDPQEAFGEVPGRLQPAIGTPQLSGSDRKCLSGTFLLVDIGSTTCDIIPVRQGKVATVARTDRDRLEQQQLVYTGYERTPVAAILDSFQIRGTTCPVMAERFAESLDASYASKATCKRIPRIWTPQMDVHALSILPELDLARMIGEDADRMREPDLVEMAEQVVQAQAARIVQALRAESGARQRQMPGHLQHCLRGTCARFGRSGHVQRDSARAEIGEFDRLSDILNSSLDISRSAPAVAVARLWSKLSRSCSVACLETRRKFAGSCQSARTN